MKYPMPFPKGKYVYIGRVPRRNIHSLAAWVFQKWSFYKGRGLRIFGHYWHLEVEE